jgi:hypothetical protein
LPTRQGNGMTSSAFRPLDSSIRTTVAYYLTSWWLNHLALDRVSTSMKAAKQTLVLVCALWLIMPPGWCCLPRSVASTPAKPVPKPCCCCPETPPSKDNSAPVLPLTHCCCEKDWTKPPTPAPFDINLGLASLFVRVDGLADARPCHLSQPVYDFHSPPIHVLQCVWRC